ncbi:hypothetical protein Q1695_012229 [Nippostrongylus brasiliensis]|nr:hypothetical protein Q1695_012229 [Nippostrongylus brasiliensis]
MRQRIKIESESFHSISAVVASGRPSRLLFTFYITDSTDSLSHPKLNNVWSDYVTVPIAEIDESFVTDNQKEGIGDKMLKMMDVRFTPKTMHRFQWISQMLFFFGFVIFCLFYFLVYPNLHIVSVDPSCDKTKAEWFADIV